MKSSLLSAPKEFHQHLACYLNINSLKNIFEALHHVSNKILDIILLSETRLDDLFPSTQFILSDYGIPYRLDRNSNDARLFLYVCENIHSKFLKVKSDCNIKSICVEENLRKRKWCINGSYNPNRSSISNHLECLNRIINE